MEKRALGKGLGALIPEKEPEHPQQSSTTVSIDLVLPNPYQPRELFDEQGMQDLVQSIKEKGMIQPVVVRQRGDRYEIIAGERRYRAAKSLNLKELPIVIKEVSDQDSLEMALIENVQRQDLNAIEEARAYQYLIDTYGLTQERISEIIGKSRTSIANTLRLLKLPQEIQEDIRASRISFAHGRALLEIGEESFQRKLAQEIIAKGLSVRELENIIKAKRPRFARPRIGVFSTRDPFLSVMEEHLQQALGTKVRIIRKKKRGTITIEFYSQEDLDRIIHKVKGGISA
ncbi:MAG TPA: ParB/RepB/Spo0J family partition protein [Candidatus Omnitrophota bacterium]|nr:ParB/RepB/Spo0J family partition protein [Candidatus Omnitrophota bacterium]HPT07182.1 ParB/RepB/Spo0J family partition protein [Candidatus Omnitrophota bacterium]